MSKVRQQNIAMNENKITSNDEHQDDVEERKQIFKLHNKYGISLCLFIYHQFRII